MENEPARSAEVSGVHALQAAQSWSYVEDSRVTLAPCATEQLT